MYAVYYTHAHSHNSLQTLQGERAKDLENAIALDTKISEDIKKLESRLEEKIDGGSAASSAEIASKVEEMKVRVQKLGEQVEGVQGQVAEHADKISGLKQACLSDLEQIKVEVGKCGTDVGAVRQRVEGVEEKVAAVDSLVEKLEATEGKVVSLEEKHAVIEGSYVTKEALETVLAENSAAMDVELKPLSSKVDEIAKKIVELESGGVSDEAVAALECIKQIKQQVSLAAVAAEVDAKTDALDVLIKQVQGDMDKKAKGTEEDDAGKLQVRLGDLERSTTEMKERVAKLDEQVEKSVDKGIGKVEENLNFRLDSMKIDQLKKDVVELTKLGNISSGEINRLDEAVVVTNTLLNKLKDLVHELLESEDK
jgi:archaellum component FlaC